jgi:5-formyltetrahydrofolate cyclo-ligase
MDKDSIRKVMKEKRGEMKPALRKTLSQRIYQRIACRPEYTEAVKVAFYYPWKGEVELLDLAIQALKKGKGVFFPKVVGETLAFCPVKTLKELSPGYKGIPEPTSSPVNPGEIGLFLVPGVAFDWEGYRLGMGGGFYDRALGTLKQYQVSLGVAYNFQLVGPLPRNWWDRKVDVIVTESTIITPFTSWNLKRRVQ